MSHTIEFFWDAVSPYAYLAATQIEDLAARCGASIRWRPFLLGKVLESSGNRPPISVPAKGQYLLQDIRQWASYYGVPLTMPKTFPVSSIIAQRMACAVPEEQSGLWAQAAMSAYWAKGEDISQPEVLKAAAIAAGLDGEALLASAQDPAIKEQLRLNTEESLKRGTFGAPSFYVGERLFWGNDRLPLLEAYLKGTLGS